jgi:microcystin-dependent protein
LPVGTTAQRPGSPATGDTRVNSTLGQVEAYDGSAWINLGGGTPTGAIYAMGTSTVPTGFLECNGAAVSRSTYATLFSTISTTFGAGDGSSTFNLPDLRGEFIRGWDNSRGVDSGRTLGSTQADELKAHTHTYIDQQADANGGYRWWKGGDNDCVAADKETESTGGSETRPRNVALMYVIKT